MTKEQLLERLKQCAESRDTENAHQEADDALIEYIDDADISKAFNDLEKWYA